MGSVVSRFTLSTVGPARRLVPHRYFWKSPRWYADWSSVTMPSPASGKATATTTTETRGGRSATKVTDGSAGNRRAAADSSHGADRRDRARANDFGRRAGVAGHIASQHLDVRLPLGEMSATGAQNPDQT